MNRPGKQILAIVGSTRQNSSNEAIIRELARLYKEDFRIDICTDIINLPHFSPDLDNENVPTVVKDFRQKIIKSDGVIFCTPEYVFSLPGSLKNAIEWTVSTTVFSEKPVSIITAAASGEKAHESLILIMKTLYARVELDATLLIKGSKGKVDEAGRITDDNTVQELKKMMDSFRMMLR